MALGAVMIIANIEVCPLEGPFKPRGASAASAWGDQDLPLVDTVLAKITSDRCRENCWGHASHFSRRPGLLAGALGAGDTMIEWRYVALEAQIYSDALAPQRDRMPVPQSSGPRIDPDADVIRRCSRVS